jgi:UDP-glucose:(glucosyl)LPS alpha-1,2-glucosyltransferase
MTDNFDLMEMNELSKNSMGGTERMQRFLYDGRIPRDLLSNFQIVLSRETTLDPSKVRIFYAHDLAGDPAAAKALADGRWRRYHQIVFVSYTQMSEYLLRYNIAPSRCIVMRNAIVPITDERPARDPRFPVRLVYTPTPHRGLDILFEAFQKLSQVRDVHLDVFSSFELYGWGQRDEEFKSLFERLKNHPHVTYHGTQPNEVVRDHLIQSDIFTYPSTWPETSCLCLIEAMSAGLQCVHSSLGALPETSASWTAMYPFTEDQKAHVNRFLTILTSMVDAINHPETSKILTQRASVAKQYIDSFYSWDLRTVQWIELLRSLVNEPRSMLAPDNNSFQYRV